MPQSMNDTTLCYDTAYNVVQSLCIIYMVIPIILEKLPDKIRLVISRKLGTNNWCVDDVLEILKHEIATRENCDFLKTHSENKFEKSGQEKNNKQRRVTVDALLTGSHKRSLKCAFCSQDHYHDKCNVVTDYGSRKNIIWQNKLCFKCLRSGHLKRNCESKSKCYQCKSNSHHTAVCDKSEQNNHDIDRKPEKENEPPDENSVSMNMINSKTTVFLQTASAYIFDDSSERSYVVKVLFDPRSQQTYISQRIADRLDFTPISQRKMPVKTFGTDKVNDMLLNGYNFSLIGIKKKTSVNLRQFAVPLICGPLSGQRIRIVKEECSFLQGLDLADKDKGDSDVDVLIGADYYWDIVEGEIKRENNERLIALKSKLGWLLSGPLTTTRPVAVSVNLASTHVLKVDIALQDETLGDKINEFWSLDSIGICDKESSVYEECIDKIELVSKYRFYRVIFGATYSQFLLNATIEKHMSKFIDIDREFVEKVLRLFYVDDLNCGVNSVEDGVNFYEKLESILLEANFNLRKWRTNSVELRKMIYKKEKQTKRILICKENFIERENILKNDCTVTENSDFVAKENNFDGEMKGEKILGIRWEEYKDVLIIDLKELLDGALCYVPTKRNILRVIAGVYNLIQPLVVKFKILFEEICLANVGWDDNIPENLEKKWFNIIDDVKQNERVNIQRCYYLHDVGDPIAKNEIHGFSDASEVVYRCCVYIKYITQSGNIGVS